MKLTVKLGPRIRQTKKVWQFPFMAVILWAALNPGWCSAQTADLTQLQERAQHFAQQGLADSALVYYQQIGQAYWQQKQIVDFIYSYIDAASLFTQKAQYTQATTALEQARRQLNQPRDLDEQWAFLWLYIHLGHNYHQTGNYLLAKDRYETALLDYVGEDDEDFDVANFLYRPLGNIYTRLGAHQQAFQLLDRFRSISLEAGDFDAATEALSDLGILFFDQRNYRQATQYYLEALDLENIRNQSRALVMSNLAGAYMELKQYPDAISVSRRALKLFEQHNSSDNRELAAYKSGAHSKLAQAYLAQDQFEAAQRHFETALDLSLEAYGTLERRETAKIYLGLGRLYLAIDDIDQALYYFHQTLGAVLPGVSSDTDKNPSNENLFAENSLMEALEGKAQVFRQQYTNTPQQKLLKQALDCYRLIFTVESKLRQNYQFESSKLFQLNESHQRSEQAIDLAFKLYKDQPSAQHFQQAFSLSEQARSVVLKESLQDSKAQNFAGIPDSIHVYERELKINLSLLRKSILADSMSVEELESHRDQIFRLEQDQKKLVSYLENEFPAYFNLKYQPDQAISVDSLQAKLSQQEVILEYFYGEQALYLFKITAADVDLIRVPNTADLQTLIGKMFNYIRDFQKIDVTDYHKVAHQLYLSLLDPAGLTPGQSLLIIPDGPLGHLPFSALVKNDQPQTNYKQLEYLLYDHPINYAYSLSLLDYDLGHRGSSEQQKPFLGIAPVYEQSNNFLYLNHSESTIERISKKLGGDKLLKSAATKQQFMSVASEYQMIHISSHAQALDSLSVYSWISFSDHQLPHEDDHKLYLSELYALSIPAELVILGACETGAGKFRNGEGVMSLARGFIHAGTKSVITTLWPVSNNATNQIMSGFYDHLMTGQAKHLALRQAQLDYLQDGNTDGLGAHPFFWAAYIPLGDTNPIEPTGPKNNYWMALIILTLVGVVWWGIKNRRIKRTHK